MARMGRFAGPSEPYGQPLSYIHPADNDFAKARFNPILLDPRLKLTNAQRRRLQDKSDRLAASLAAGQDRAGRRTNRKRGPNEKPFRKRKRR
jgi:hypothetical protein